MLSTVIHLELIELPYGTLLLVLFVEPLRVLRVGAMYVASRSCYKFQLAALQEFLPLTTVY
jgi:hypothetical protein